MMDSQTLYVGLIEGLSPYALATILLFVVGLCVVGSKRYVIWVSGTWFIIAVLVFNLIMVVGLFERFIMEKHLEGVIVKIDLVIAAYIIILGILNFIDWCRYKMQPDVRRFILPLPSWLMPADISRPPEDKETFSQKIPRAGVFIIISTLAGVFLTILNYPWPKSYLALIAFYGLYIGNQKVLAVLSLVLNSLGYVLPLILVLSAFMLVGQTEHLKVRLVKSVALVKIFSSALCLSVGFGLVYLLTKYR